MEPTAAGLLASTHTHSSLNHIDRSGWGEMNKSEGKKKENTVFGNVNKVFYQLKSKHTHDSY